LNYTQPPNASNNSAGGEYGQEFLPSGLNGDWQSDKDMHLRREMIQHIVKMLKQKDNNASPEWITKLPQMVKQLEVSLYRSAQTFQAYADITTLKSRLQQLAMEIAKKSKAKDKGGGDGGNSRSTSRGQESRGEVVDSRHRPTSGGNLGNMQQQPHSHSQQQNYSIGGTPRGGNNVIGEEPVSSQHGNPNDPEWKIRIKHKQQRLLLLHHSSKCPFDGDECKVTPYCGEMKKLWKHMARCTDNDCRVPHCFSSRSILSHYRKCKDPRCPACGPVRETVRKTQKGKSSSNSPRGSSNDAGQWPPMDMPTSGGGGGVGHHNNNMMDNSMAVNPPPMNNMQMNPPPMNSMVQQQPPMNNNGSIMGAPHNPNGMPVQPNNAYSGHNTVSMGGPPPPQDQGHRNGYHSNNPDRPRSLPADDNNFTHENDAKAKHKRQRLLLLRHASKCSAPPGQCKQTPHCAEMKVLWKHIASCKESQCTVRHCMSSRYVLSHYRRCKGPCTICDPVRDAIKNGFSGEMAVDGAMPTESATPPEPVPKRPRTVVPPPSNPMECQPVQKSQSPKPAATSEDHSLLECFTTDQVKTHLHSLKRYAKVAPAELKLKCVEVLKELQSHEHGWVFATPVNPVELGLDDYFEVIKKPMDLGTIQKNLEAGSYHAYDDFKSDVRLTFENAMKYNEEKTVVHEMAKQLKKKFEQDYKKLLKQMDREHAENSKKVQACGLCGCEKLLFEPTVFFCNGLNCPSTRIRRNHNFYITGDKQYSWCNQCYTELGDTIDLGTMQVKKEALTKRKNDETHEESWVQCDDCERWIHQVCGLYNTRQDKENKSAYSCPLCVLDRREKQGDPKILPPPPCAEDLPRTKLSEWLEKDVHEKVDKRMKELASEKADTENISYDEAYKSLSSGGPVTIRQVTSTDRKHEVREAIKARYIKKDYPDEFPYRCKCIVVFQNIDGVDVVLFALYVYEHGDDNPFPNKKTVYVSYLDSVHFLKPRKMRTFIYHEILISYLDYARAKGFEQAFIWACPPLKGDDYIFYAKPEDQKIPKEVRLRQWYLDMLDECQRRNVVGKVTNMYDQYLADNSLDFSCVPYFEGDYFPGEAENIIKTLNESGEKKSGGGGKKKAASKSKKSSSNKSPEANVYNGGKDIVMQKFCEAIEGMKHSFIVAFLNCKTAKPENLVVPKKIMEYRKANGIICDAVDNTKLEAEKSAAVIGGSKASDDDKAISGESKTDAEEKKSDGVDEEVSEAAAAEKTKSSSEASGENGASAVGTPSKGAGGSDKNPESGPSCPPTEEKLPLSKKRNVDGKAVAVPSDTTSSSSDNKLDRNGKPLRILDDDTEEIDCEFFNSRQCFLDLCRGNHYQFDELRRAKHTSMMVLWHLQNREAPKFVQQCFACAREISSGYRHHCNVCPDLDLCTDCFRDPSANRGSCNHKLEAIRVDNQGASSGLTEEQRKERQRNIQLHITLIEHASRCTSATCKSSNCQKMKSYLKHGSVCTVKASGGCKLCKRIWTLLRIHAQQCKSNSCPIPQCIAIRKRIRQLQQKQQAMDDRRRQEMNRHYRMGVSGN